MSKLGLVLEGGGMRGIYTAGVLDFFLDKQIDVDGVIGVSAGACHATSYLSKQRGRNYRVNTKYLGTKEYLSLTSLIKTGSLFGMEFMFHKIPEELEPYDYDVFNQSKTEYITVATDLNTGDADYHIIKDMHKEIDYIQASSSLPLLSKVVSIDGKELMDGGCSDSIPFQYMMGRGYDKNIVVLTQCASYRKGKNNLLPIIRHNYKKYPNVITALANRHIRYNKALDELEALEKAGKIFVIRPSKPVNISRVEKNLDKLQALYEEGYQDAQNQYEALKAYMQHETVNG